MAILAQLLKREAYKPGQGRIVRRSTFAAVALLLIYGLSSLNQQLALVMDSTPRTILVSILAAAAVWISYRVINYDRFAEFLISTESEAERVVWPARPQVVQSTIIVITAVALMGVLLLVMDLIWKQFFTALGFLRIDV